MPFSSEEPTTWPPYKASACDYRREALAVMRPAAVPGRTPLDFRASSELAAPPYNRAIEQAAIGQILQQRSHPGVQFRQLVAHCFEAVASRYPEAAEATKAVILELGAVIGDSNALKLQRGALKSPNKQLSAAALRALAKWPNESSAADPLELAKNASEAVDRIVALKGYIRLAGLNTARLSDTQRVRMLRTAMKLATRPEERKQIIGAMQHVKSIESLETLQQYLDSPELEAEAQISAANLLWDMRRSRLAEVMAIAKKLAASKSRAVSDKAKRTLKDLDTSKWTQTLLGVAGSRMAFADC
jgi:hypothetical protein